MKHLPRILSLGALALVGALFSSCSTPSTSTAGTSFAFKPRVTQPTNRSAVAVKISTSAGRLYVTEGDKVLLATPCAVGTASSPTPMGNHRINGKIRHRRRQSAPGAGYPMTYWMSFYSPTYGMHWGFVKPYPCTHGCVRMPLNSARTVFDMVQVGTPVNVSTRQPWDSTVGASVPRVDDSALPDPPMSYMLSPQVFQDAEQGKMWNF